MAQRTHARPPAAGRRRARAVQPAGADHEPFFALSLDLLCIVGFDGYFKDLNPSWDTALGHSRETLMARPLVDFVHPDDREATLAKVRQLIEGRAPGAFENRWRRADGSYLWLLWNCSVAADRQLFYCIARDITLRKERELQSRLYQAIVANSADAITIIDLDGRYVEQNEAHRRLLGYSDEDLIGKTPALHCGEKEFNRSFEGVTQRHRFRGEMENITRDGRHLVIELSAFAVRDAKGSPVCFVGIKRDMTDRKHAEQALREATEVVRRSLVEKEALLKEVNHRVKNNLQVIYSLLNLQASYVRDPHTLDVLRESQNRIKAMALIHEQLYRSKDLGRIDVRAFLSELTANLSRSHGTAAGRTTLGVDVDDVPIGLDTVVPCGLIVNELVSNSLKHAFPGGGGGHIDVVLRSLGGGRLRLAVADDGVGLPVDIDPDRTQSLGLQLVATLIHQIGGTLALSRDHGTSFAIEFAEPGVRDAR